MRDTGPEIDERVRSFLEKYGNIGKQVLDIFNEIDFAHSGMPDEYLSYARRFMEHIKDKGEKPAEEEIDQAVDASFSEDQRNKFYQKEIQQIKTAIYFRIYYPELVDVEYNMEVEEEKPMQIVESSEGGKVTFSFENDESDTKAFLRCEIDKQNKIFTARTMSVKEKYQRQSLGTQMFLAAINYAKHNGYKFVTDTVVSEKASALIESLAVRGYNFIKNTNIVEKQEDYGKNFVSQDGAPVYTLIE